MLRTAVTTRLLERFYGAEYSLYGPLCQGSIIPLKVGVDALLVHVMLFVDGSFVGSFKAFYKGSLKGAFKGGAGPGCKVLKLRI